MNTNPKLILAAACWGKTGSHWTELNSETQDRSADCAALLLNELANLGPNRGNINAVTPLAGWLRDRMADHGILVGFWHDHGLDDAEAKEMQDRQVEDWLAMGCALAPVLI